MSTENLPLLAVFIDGDLIAAATQPKKAENPSISSSIAPKPELAVPHNLVRTIEQHFFAGKCATRIKTCFFTAGADGDADVKAHKAAVIAAMKSAGFQCKIQSVDRAYSTDAVITSKAMKVLYKNHSVTSFIFLTHSPHLEAILEEVTDDGKDSYLVALGVTGAANIAPEVRALLTTTTKSGQSAVLTLQSSDLFGVPFDESALNGTTPFSQRKTTGATATSAAPAPATPAPVMPVTTPPPLADQPNPLSPPAPTTTAPTPAPTPAPTVVTAPAAVTTLEEATSRPLRDQADPTNQLSQSQSQTIPAAAPPAQPAITDFRLAPGCNAYWDKNYKRFYYVVSSPGQPNVTTWSHPGGQAEHARIEGLVAQWQAQVNAAAQAQPQPAPTLVPQPAVQAAVVPTTKVEPEPTPAPVTTPAAVPNYANVPPNDKNAIAAAQLQAQPVVLNPPVAQPATQPAAAPPTPTAASQPALPKGWERHIDQTTGRPYYYDTINKKTTWELPPQ